MRAIAAPTSLKGVLSAVAAADALAAGLAAGGADATSFPVADGGDGTLDVLERALGGERRSATVSGPLGDRVRAEWLVSRAGTAVVESAQALGFRHGVGARPAACVVPRARRADPRRRRRCRVAARLPGRHGDGRRRRRHARGARRVAAADAGRLRRPLAAPRRRVRLRTAEGRARRSVRRARRSGCAGSRTCRARERPARSALRSPRSAPSSCPARRSCST